MDFPNLYRKAAAIIRRSRALVVAAGAGMGVDSGLPDFRGERGFWNAYPMYERLGISFIDAANPAYFEADPAFGWGFYGHRTNLYRETSPHAGFYLILDWCKKLGLDLFVVTSNVDGQFQKAGYADERILEVHGSIHWLQCTGPCSRAVWENGETITVDFATMRARHIPKCVRCGAAARPNILMFGDWSWISDRTDHQERRFEEFLNRHRHGPMTVIEMGAGTAIPTIRRTSETLGRSPQARVIRINPREGEITPPHISMPCGALEGLCGIGAALSA
ncbi:MAG TPA: Sir2 family NAD-dependent protein deacetylase [Geobacteraceae bacterium]|nr:Sir2 family NAD-dependent protein deacetylase [Geobacteraceae bacterium]